MSADLADLHEELRSVARDVLAAADPAADVDPAVLGRAGWLGLEVPDDLDGAGATFAEVAVVCEELGRAAAAGPYLGTAVLGVGALTAAEPGDLRDRLLRGVAAGDVVTAVALDGGAEDPTDALPAFRLERASGAWRLSGRAAFVPDATDGAQVLAFAADPQGAVVLAAVDPGAAGLTVAAQPVLDASRRLGTVAAEGVVLPDEAVWRLAGTASDAIPRLRRRAAVALACDSLGAAAAMLERTVAYAGVREQFGRPVGSFQAVKHACADMLVRIAVSRQLVADAVRRVADDEPGADVAVAMAASHAGETGVEVAGAAMQLHGGIGYTWESGIHVYLKRTALNRALFGSPAAHRARLAARYR